MKKLEGFGKVKDSKATKQIVALLSAPLEKYNDVVTVLKLTNYSKVMEHLDYGTNKAMSGMIIQSIMKNTTLITEAEKVANLNNLLKLSMLNEFANSYIPQVEALFELLREVIIDSEGIPGIDEVSSFEYDRCQLHYSIRANWHMLLQLDEEDFMEEQNLVARLVQMLVNTDNDEMFKVKTVKGN